MDIALRRRPIDTLDRAATAVTAIAAIAFAAGGAAASADVVAYRIDGDGIAAPLAERVGDAARGRALVVARDPANCMLCHTIPDGDVATAGDVGPSLAGIGSRMTLAQLRLRVVDERSVERDSVMPSYYRVDGLRDVAPRWRDKPILSADQVEDIVAYLATLK